MPHACSGEITSRHRDRIETALTIVSSAAGGVAGLLSVVRFVRTSSLDVEALIHLVIIGIAVGLAVGTPTALLVARRGGGVAIAASIGFLAAAALSFVLVLVLLVALLLTSFAFAP